MNLKLRVSSKGLKSGIVATISLIILLSITQKALAHHAIGGRTPENFLEGFLSGLAHPIIGLDHFAFVVASGLLAIQLTHGFLIPIGFVISTLIGTTLHVQGINLPFPEIIIAASVVLFGIMLALEKQQTNQDNIYLIALVSLGILAGIFHGYAYAEAIVGAKMSPLVAYLSGFTLIQLSIATIAFFAGRILQEKLASFRLKWLGWGISALGVVFLTSAVFG